MLQLITVMHNVKEDMKCIKASFSDDNQLQIIS